MEGVQEVVLILKMKAWGAMLERTSGRWEISPQMANTGCMCSTSLGHQIIPMKNVGGVQGLAYILNLRAQLVVNTRTSGAGHLVCTTKN